MLSRMRARSLASAPPRSTIPYLVLAVGLVATAAVAVYTRNTARAKDDIRFDNEAQDVRDTLLTRIDTYVALLRAGAGLFSASSEVRPQEFRDFVGRLELRSRYPGIQGIGFAVRVPAERLESVVADIRASTFPDFAVRPAGARPDYYPIIYLEPLDRRNRAAVGYDMFAEPVRHAAMTRAARTASPAASGKVTLVQEIDAEKQAGFLIYVPIYTGGQPPVTEADRERALRGFVYSPFRAGDLLQTVVGAEQNPSLEVRVYDGTEPNEAGLLFRTAVRPPKGFERQLRKTLAVDVAGRSWLLAFASRPEFEGASDVRLVPWILVVGLGVSLLLFVATRAEVTARAEAEHAATELRRSEEALRASEAELRRLVEAERQAHTEAAAANRAKDEFLATLSHELRTPLNAIVGWAAMLKKGHLTPAQESRAFDVIARNAQTQAELIEDLFDVSRIITGKLRLELRPILLAPAIQAALDTVRPTAVAKGVALDWHPATDGPMMGDPDRLQQVVWNLLSNAIKFTPPGGRVVASLRLAAGHVEFRVADTGIGIPAAFLPDVFERFRQHDSSTTRKHGGMGLGLAIVRHLVEAHGGTVSAESPGEGAGSTFTVSLPARAVAARDARATARSGEDAVAGFLAGLHTLVVDDDADSREVLSGMLTQAGASVTLASSADEALELAGRVHFDVLIADIGMPEADGYALVRRIRAHPSEWVRKVPALAVTAYARKEDRDLALAAGFQKHLPKPVQVAALLTSVREVIAAAGQPAGAISPGEPLPPRSA